ncbi:MAG: ABC transporter ATP-binding protein, partial [Pseudomonadota bacterium]
MIKTPRSLLLRIWREHLSLYSGQLFLALTFMGALAAAEVGFILATEWIFAGLEPERSTRFQSVTPQQVVVFGPIFVIGLAILQAFFFYLQAITAQGVGVSVLRDLQVRMYSAITAYDLSQLKGRGGEGDSRLGGLVSRFTNDMTVLRESLRRVPNAARDVIRLIGFISVLAFLDPILFGCVLLIYPLIGFPITIIGKAIRRLARRVQGQIGDVTGLLTESLSGQEMIKSYRLEDHETERLAEAFDERRRLLMRLVRLRSANEPIITIIAAVAVAFIIAVAALRIEAGSLTGPELVAFLVAMALLSQPARGLGTLNAVLQEGLAAIERVFGVIDDEPRIIDPSEPKALGITVGSAPAIAFEGVDFAYEEDAPILKDFSLHIPRGSTVALVGPSGAGKSTVFGLLPRFYDRASGTITIEGTGIEQVSLDDLRRSISVVSQTPILFDVSVKENIRLGQLDASDADIEAAAKA